MNSVSFLKVTVQNNSDGINSYYAAKLGVGKVLVNASGGNGGNGGNGGTSSPGRYPGDGGDASDGGNGGVIILHIDPSAKPYEQMIITKVNGGDGGEGGLGGSAYINNTPNSNLMYGKNGRQGRSGRMGKIEFKYETIEKLNWY